MKKSILRRKHHFLLLLILTLILFGNTAMTEERTILMYIIGCDLEADSGAVTDDLMEILHATADSAGHVIAYLGGSEVWWMPEMNNSSCYLIEIMNGKMNILEEYGIQSSANEEQLCKFLQTNGDNGDDLILWGHGFPGFDGIGVDKLAHDDTLTLSEIKSALESSNIHFRLIGFDACEMATLEAAWLVAPYTDYYAASSEKEYLSGWDYRTVVRNLAEQSPHAPLYLREVALQNAKRGASNLPLTVLDERALIESTPYMNRLLNYCLCPGLPVSMAELIEICSDKETGNVIRKVLDGQILMISNIKTDTNVDLTGIRDSYISFLRRR